MKFFKSTADRNLWLKLNAEHQIEWEKNLTYFDVKTGKHLPTMQARYPRSMERALEIAKNQLKYDEENGELRYTLEDYLTLTNEQLEEKRLKQHLEWINNFLSLK